MPLARIPYDFILDELSDLDPYTKPMFGCHGIYVGERIVLIVRDKENSPEDKGVWVATIPEHHVSLRKELRSLRSIAMFGPGETGWQVIPFDGPAFEEEVLYACGLVRKKDIRIGKIPKSRKKSKKKILKTAPRNIPKKSVKKPKKAL